MWRCSFYRFLSVHLDTRVKFINVFINNNVVIYTEKRFESGDVSLKSTNNKKTQNRIEWCTKKNQRNEMKLLRFIAYGVSSMNTCTNNGFNTWLGFIKWKWLNDESQTNKWTFIFMFGFYILMRFTISYHRLELWAHAY